VACGFRRITSNAWEVHGAMGHNRDSSTWIEQHLDRLAASRQVLGTALCDMICGCPAVGCRIFGEAKCVDISDSFRTTSKDMRLG
jgi:hypothetical protein